MSAVRAMASHTGYEVSHARQLLVGFVPILLIGFLSVALPRWTKRGLVPCGSLEALLSCHALAFILGWLHPQAGLLLHVLAALLAAAVVAHHSINSKARGAAYVATLIGIHATAGAIAVGATDPSQTWVRTCIAAVVLLCLELSHRIARALVGAAVERCGLPPLKPGVPSLVLGQRLSAAAALALWSLGVPCAVPACIAGAVGCARLFELRPWRIPRMAGLAAVLAGVAWLNIGFLGLATTQMAGYLMPDVATIHMWSVGGLGTTAIAVMTSITRKRDRMSFRPGIFASLAYVWIALAAFARLLAFAVAGGSQEVLLATRLYWICAFSCCLVFVGVGSRGMWRQVTERRDRW
jgi:uncharacterized protein involved in response to NO